MLQSLLKERFGLAVHYETQDTPVLVMSFAKQRKLGPKLRRHKDGPACSITGKSAEAAAIELKQTDIFPAKCRGIEGVPTKEVMILLTTFRRKKINEKCRKLGDLVFGYFGFVLKRAARSWSDEFPLEEEP